MRRSAKKALYVMVAALAVVSLGLIFYFAVINPEAGPRFQGSSAEAEETYSAEELAEMRSESERLERRFEELTENPTWGEEALEVLEEAFELQRTVVRNDSDVSFEERDRTERLEERLNEYRAEYWFLLSEDLESEAEARRDAGDYEEAVALIREAWELQTRINRDVRRSQYSSTARASSLDRRSSNWEAEPISQESRLAETAAREAEEEGRWSDALELYEEALEKQERINRDFRRTPYIDRIRVNDLASRITSLQTREAREAILAHEEAAEGYMAEGRYEEASARFAQAAERQSELNDEFPESGYASARRVRELEARRQTALSAELAQQVEEAAAAADEALRLRRLVEAGELLDEANGLIERLRTEYPESDLIDETLNERIDFLVSLDGALEEIHEIVYAHLEPVPGREEEVLLYGRETPQNLYYLVTESNPSRNQGEDLPVDSIRWDEAQAFCEKLSTILARPVRLPSLEEFEAAAGELGGEAIAEQAWHLRNSDGESRPVATLAPNDHGFYDLYGNVAEWLDRSGGGGQAVIAGGDFNDDLLENTDFPARTVDVTHRSRSVGFRFAVENGD